MRRSNDAVINDMLNLKYEWMSLLDRRGLLDGRKGTCGLNTAMKYQEHVTNRGHVITYSNGSLLYLSLK